MDTRLHLSTLHSWHDGFPFFQAVADEITAAVADTRSALEGEDPNLIKDKVNALQQATMKIGQAMQNSGEQSPPEAEESTAGEKKD